MDATYAPPAADLTDDQVQRLPLDWSPESLVRGRIRLILVGLSGMAGLDHSAVASSWKRPGFVNSSYCRFVENNLLTAAYCRASRRNTNAGGSSQHRLHHGTGSNRAAAFACSAVRGGSGRSWSMDTAAPGSGRKSIC